MPRLLRKRLWWFGKIIQKLRTMFHVAITLFFSTQLHLNWDETFSKEPSLKNDFNLWCCIKFFDLLTLICIFHCIASTCTEREKKVNRRVSRNSSYVYVYIHRQIYGPNSSEHKCHSQFKVSLKTRLSFEWLPSTFDSRRPFKSKRSLKVWRTSKLNNFYQFHWS